MCDCHEHDHAGRAAGEIPAYDAQTIEEKWVKSWEEQNLFAVDTDSTKPKKYVLEMFPYPSGDLHMGHARNYTIGDAMARQARMRGYDVLHPIGFDAFGLPAENAAIKHNTQAAAWTYKNMDQALATMKRMGFSYDMDRLVKTCSPITTVGASGFSRSCGSAVWSTARRTRSTGAPSARPCSLTSR